MAQHRQVKAERANQAAQRGERPRDQRVLEVAPLAGQANISTDGTMILVRGEGWKEVKLTAMSQVHGTTERIESESRRAQDPAVTLCRHSYEAGLWDADTMGAHQYAEGLRGGVERVKRLTSVNDGAPWIERITETNFPHAVQIVNSSHASGRLWRVANEKSGEGTAAATQWAEPRLDELWNGRVGVVLETLQAADLAQEKYSAEVRQAAGYFESNQRRMRYEEFRAAGYPIGSGTMENGGQSVVHARMRRPGRGWKHEKAQATLAGLSELRSDRFDLAWQMNCASTTLSD
jgi:hypothetical protein